MAKLPKFKSDEEMAEWFDTHDTAEYMDGMEVVTKDFELIRTSFATRPLDIRVRSDHFAALQEIAERKGIPYQMLVPEWLFEKLNEEVSELV
jgi:predicted DNA binding CopG/RHH family protein